MELNDLFKAYNEKMDVVISANESVLTQMNLESPKNSMRQVYYKRIIEVVLFGVLAIFFGWYVFNRMGNTNLLICGIIASFFNIIALSGSITQLLLTNQINYSKPLLEIKEKINKVSTHELYIVKILLLSAPFWWAFMAVVFDILWGIDFIGIIDTDIRTIYLLLNILLIIPLIYFLKQLNHHNIHKKMVRKTISLFSSNQVLKALEALNYVENFKK